MASEGLVVFGILLLVTSSSGSSNTPITHFDVSWLNRSSFPSGFVFGTASSSYQYEGAAKEGGRGPSIWDYYTHKYPEKIDEGSNGDVANDEYHRYKEDVEIMKEMNLDAYRFSISWSRLLPKLCFREFGDRVKHWMTLNEPWTYASGGYATGMLAPFRCSEWQQHNCTGGDSGTEPYLVSHHQLLSHAAAVKIYKDKYQVSQKGLIGIALPCHWMVPFSNAKHNRNAALRALDFMFGWFMDPLTNAIRNGIPIGPKAASDWLYVYPRGILDLLLYTKRKYHNPLIYITENGIDEYNDPILSLEQALIDNQRIDFYHSHLYYLQEAIKDGVNVKGYFAWSLLDNFEWSSGFTVRFGINYVDYKDGLKRHPKLSAHWFKAFLKKL
ncbi:hypothetical protein FNV43_RR09877 [Rhamnella rubrinervis]|uniref:Beta-glucosidase n=1 Tax=Rhamnella rubrinervis TaxID=2594499 RepID=A0A8K0MK71_9ROSA|nr:hypothetical protein FNV43_RR09877 [Rhamnella rubrinervis]